MNGGTIDQTTPAIPPKAPWLKFFPADWLGDELLALCSMAARGLLAALVCVMHKGVPYGHLLLNGKRPTDAELTRLVRGKSRVEVRRLVTELLERGVLSTTADGTIYSRRMVREATKGAINRTNGKKGAGARWGPDGHGEHDGDGHGEHDGDGYGEHDGEHDGPIASSFCVSSTSETRKKNIELLRDFFELFWAAYPRHVKKDAAWREWRRIDPTPDVDFTATVIAAVARQKAGWDEPKFIPHASTWLHGRRWQDEPEPVADRVARPVDDAAQTSAWLDELRSSR